MTGGDQVCDGEPLCGWDRTARRLRSRYFNSLGGVSDDPAFEPAQAWVTRVGERRASVVASPAATIPRGPHAVMPATGTIGRP